MNPRERPNTDPVELAIGRVLQAERAAQQSIAAAQAAAQARLAASRVEVLGITERAEGRIALARRGVESRIAARQTNVEAKIQALRADAAAAAAGSARIDQAVAALAASMTGAGPP